MADPDGNNGYKTSRDPPITTLDYFQSRHLSSNTRWAWSCNLLEQRRLNENISVAIRMRSSSGSAHMQNCSVFRQSSDDTSHEDQHLTARTTLTHVMVLCIKDMRDTIAYWHRAKMDLLAMFRTLGPPTFFITLTADDMNWPDLLYEDVDGCKSMNCCAVIQSQ